MPKDFEWAHAVHAWIEEFKDKEIEQDIILPLDSVIPEGEKSSTTTQVQDRIRQINEVAKVHLRIGLEEQIRAEITKRNINKKPDIDSAIKGFQSDLKLSRRLDALPHVLVYVSLVHPKTWAEFVRNAQNFSHENPLEGISREFPGPTFSEIERLRLKYGYKTHTEHTSNKVLSLARNNKYKFVVLCLLIILFTVFIRNELFSSNIERPIFTIRSMPTALINSGFSPEVLLSKALENAKDYQFSATNMRPLNYSNSIEEIVVGIVNNEDRTPEHERLCPPLILDTLLTRNKAISLSKSEYYPIEELSISGKNVLSSASTSIPSITWNVFGTTVPYTIETLITYDEQKVYEYTNLRYSEEAIINGLTGDMLLWTNPAAFVLTHPSTALWNPERVAIASQQLGYTKLQETELTQYALAGRGADIGSAEPNFEYNVNVIENELYLQKPTDPQYALTNAIFRFSRNGLIVFNLYISQETGKTNNLDKEFWNRVDEAVSAYEFDSNFLTRHEQFKIVKIDRNIALPENKHGFTRSGELLNIIEYYPDVILGYKSADRVNVNNIDYLFGSLHNSIRHLEKFLGYNLYDERIIYQKLFENADHPEMAVLYLLADPNFTVEDLADLENKYSLDFHNEDDDITIKFIINQYFIHRLLMEGNFAKAIDIAKDQPLHGCLLQNIAYFASRYGDDADDKNKYYLLADSLYSRAELQGPRNRSLYESWGFLLSVAGRYQEAEEKFELALQFPGDLSWPLLDYSLALQYSKKYDDSIARALDSLRLYITPRGLSLLVDSAFLAKTPENVAGFYYSYADHYQNLFERLHINTASNIINSLCYIGDLDSSHKLIEDNISYFQRNFLPYLEPYNEGEHITESEVKDSFLQVCALMKEDIDEYYSLFESNSRK